MGTEDFANGKVVYTSVEDENRMCVENLKDDAHYRFSCRCGCGAQFAGYGKDIRAAARVGGDITAFPADPQIGDQWYNQRNNTIWVCTDRNGDRPTWNKVQGATLTTNGSPQLLDAKWSLEEAVDLADDWCEDDEDVVEPQEREETAEKPRPYVSDRYLKKARFGLSDDEVDADAEGKDDPLQTKGVDLSMRTPPAIGCMVYSLATGEGPLSLLEYKDCEITSVDGNLHRVLHAICRSEDGSYVTIPLADLAVDFDGRPKVVKQKKTSWALVTLMMVASGITGSAIGLAAWHFLQF